MTTTDTPTPVTPAQTPVETPAASSAAQTATEPAPQRTDSGPKDNSLEGRARHERDARKERMKALETAKPQATAPSGNPKAPEPASDVTAKQPEPAAKEPAKEPDTPKQPDEEKSSRDTITVKVKGDDGTVKEVEFTREECENAILREPDGAKLLQEMGKKRVMEQGSKWRLKQIEADRMGNKYAELSRAMEAIKGKSPAAPAAKDDADKSASSAAPQPAPAATPSPSSPAQATPPTNLTANEAAEVEAVRQELGDKAADALEVRFKKQAAEIAALKQTFTDELRKQSEATAKEREAQNAAFVNLVWEQSLDALRLGSMSQFPKLKDKGTFQKASDKFYARVKSGEWENPHASRGEIWDEVCQVMFGKDIQETHALQLAESRKRQLDGQPEPQGQRQSTQAAPLSYKDRLKAIEKSGSATPARNVGQSG